MAVKYKLYQDNRTTSTHKGMWYARALVSGIKDTKTLADQIQQNVSVKKSDVLAVLDELVVVMSLWLGEGYRIKLDGFGSFKVGLKTKPAETAREFTAAKHVVGSRINFQPETHWTSASGGVRNRVFLDGITCEETQENAVE
ncbi:MAG: HU family DNA-binding protein [Prevotella sp.]|nr:HU family DNA-binding protein [Prevotella sp.]